MANEKRLRIGQLESTITNDPLASGGTSITVSHDAAYEDIDSENHLALVLDPDEASGDHEIVYATAYGESGGVGTLTVTRGEEGTTARSHAQGTTLRHGPTLRDHAVGRIDWQERTAGNVAISSTSPTTVDSGIDLSVGAQAGDVLEVSVNYLLFDTNDVGLRVDFVTVPDSTETNYLSSGGGTQLSLGIPGFFGQNQTNQDGVSGVYHYRVQSGDVHNGAVVVRLKAWVSTLSRTIRASSDTPLRVAVRNLGPQEA